MEIVVIVIIIIIIIFSVCAAHTCTEICATGHEPSEDDARNVAAVLIKQK